MEFSEHFLNVSGMIHWVSLETLILSYFLTYPGSKPTILIMAREEKIIATSILSKLTIHGISVA